MEKNAQNETRSTLCGKLIFIELSEQSTTLLGLEPCDGGKPLIFSQHPADLFNYYEFRTVTIQSGTKVQTNVYGYLNSYIIGWQQYKQIQSCTECGKNVPLPINTSTPTVSPTPPTIDKKDFNKCYNFLLGKLITLLPLEGFNFLYQSLNGYTRCIIDYDYKEDEGLRYLKCSNMVDLEIIIKELVKALLKQHWAVKLGILLIDIYRDAEGREACGRTLPIVWNLIKNTSKFGLPMNALAVHSPAVYWVTDDQGRRTGFLEDGSVVEDIPDSRAVETEEGKLLFYPGVVQVSINIKGTSDGSMTVDFIRNTGPTVQDMSFEQVPLTAQTSAEFDFSVDKPILKVDLYGNGAYEDKTPDYFEEIIVEPIAPDTSTSTIETTPVDTPAPSPSQIATVNPPTQKKINFCCGSAGLGALPVGILLVRHRRRKEKNR